MLLGRNARLTYRRRPGNRAYVDSRQVAACVQQIVGEWKPIEPPTDNLNAACAQFGDRRTIVRAARVRGAAADGRRVAAISLLEAGI